MGEKSVLIGPGPNRCRAVFDTNIILSALVFCGRLGWLRAAWSSGIIVPVVCRETTAELLRVLQYPKFRLSVEDRAALLEDYLPFAEAVVLPATLPPMQIDCRDPDDAIFIRLALAAKADFLVSGDADLTSIGKIAALPIVSIEEFRSAIGA